MALWGRAFESSTCHNKNTIGEEGNLKPPREIHFPRKPGALPLFYTNLGIEYAKHHWRGRQRPPRKVHFLRRKSSSCLRFCFARNRVCDEAEYAESGKETIIQRSTALHGTEFLNSDEIQKFEQSARSIKTSNQAQLMDYKQHLN